MNKIAYLLFLLFIVASFLASCSSITRTERDVYTITDKDTLINYHITNHPGNRDNGVIYPSSKVVLPEREIVQRDSIVERYYPDFIRLGFFESIATIGGSQDYGIGTGLFGIFPDFEKLSENYRGADNYIFSGGIYRLGVTEYRLRWFRDSKNWTIGTNLIEFILPDARGENALISILPLYLRKRYYLREEIPYISFTPYLGLGYLPSYYANLGASLEFGSIAGLNLRAYLGLAAGYNSPSSLQIKDNDFVKNQTGNTVIFPYFGIGISMLDFHNLVKETEIEWKDHEHSAWDIGLLQFSILRSTADNSIYKDNKLFSGFQLKIANSFVALPIDDYKFFLGTSLINLMVVGDNNFAMAVLPFRFGYWNVLIDDELSLEPFLEYGYYPSSFFNLGAKMNLVINEAFNLGFLVGYVNCFNQANLPNDLNREFGFSQEFSQFYLGINVGIIDRIFYPQQLRYSK